MDVGFAFIKVFDVFFGNSIIISLTSYNLNV